MKAGGQQTEASSQRPILSQARGTAPCIPMPKVYTASTAQMSVPCGYILRSSLRTFSPLGGEHGFFHHPTLGQLQVFRVATSFMLQFQALITVRTSRFGDTPTGWRCFRSFMVRKPHRGWLLSCSSSRTRGIHAVASTLYLGSNVNVGSTPSDMEKSRVLFVIL